MSDTASAPPNNIPAEQAVLGAMMLNPDVIGDITRLIGPADFYRAVHATVFTTVTGMLTSGLPIDPITVAADLADGGDLVRVGGINYLHTLIENCTPASGTYYARLVADEAIERRGLEHAGKTAQIIAGTGATADKLAEIRASVDTIAGDREEHPGAWVGDLVDPAITAIEDASKPGAGGLVFPTGFSDLDRLLGGGFRPGQLVTVAARPGIGKSTLLLDFMRNMTIRANLTAALFSLEMTAEEIMQRLLSAEARVPLAFLRTGNIRQDEMDKIIGRVQSITDAPMMIYDPASLRLSQMHAECRRMKQRHNLRVAAADYLQLFTPETKRESRQQEVAEMSRGLKLLGKDQEIAVIQAAQLNRGPEQRADKRPQLSDLRESGAIEQDSDIVILLHRDDYYDQESPRAGEVDFIVAKHRGGATGTVTVANQLHLSRFVDMAIV